MTDKSIRDLWTHEWTRSDWTRRDTLDLLAKGGLAAALGTGLSGTARAATPTDDVVRIGYLPITASNPKSPSSSGRGRHWSKALPPASLIWCIF